MRCLDCQYDLSKLSEHRCPECGREFDPNDPDSFDNGEPLLYDWSAFLALLVTAVLIGGTALFLWLFVWPHVVI